MRNAKLNPAAARTQWGEEDVFTDPTCPVRVAPQDQPDTALHRHQFTELVLVTAGTGIHVVETFEYPLAPGDCFVLEGAWRHAYRETSGLQLVNVLIRGRCMERLRPNIRPLAGYGALFQERSTGGPRFVRPRTLTPHELDECLRLGQSLRDEGELRPEGVAAMQEALLQMLLITLCRLLAGRTPATPDTHIRIARAIRHLETHFREEVTLAQLERMAGMSGRALQRNFRAATGVTPMRYLLRTRISHAARLLSETTRKVSDIGAECGLPDSAYFARLFHQFTGMSPSVWRTSHHH